MSKAALARAAGCSTALLYSCEHGYRPGPEKSQALAAALSDALSQKVTPADLWPSS